MKWFLHENLCCSNKRMVCCDMSNFEKYKHKLKKIAYEEFEMTNLVMETRLAYASNEANTPGNNSVDEFDVKSRRNQFDKLKSFMSQKK
jgi:hypothetical protein